MAAQLRTSDTGDIRGLRHLVPSAVRKAVRELQKTGAYRNRISAADVPDIVRRHRLRCSRLPEADIQEIPALWREIIDLYEKGKRRRNVLDEEDLAPFAIRSMENKPDVLKDWRSRVGPRLLVDDFQNLTQV